MNQELLKAIKTDGFLNVHYFVESLFEIHIFPLLCLF